MIRKKNKHGFLFIPILIGIMLLVILVLTLVLIFSDTIQSTVSTLTDFFSTAMPWIFGIVALLIAWQTGFLVWLLGGIQAILRRIIKI